MCKRQTARRVAVAIGLSVLTVTSAVAQVTVKIGSVAPAGSDWVVQLQRMSADWQRITDGQVRLQVYPGGIAGDEPDMLRKARVGQLNAVAISSRGLSRLYPDILSMMIPLQFTDQDEFEFVFERMRPTFEAEIERRGFKVLAWTTAGWIYLFSRDPVATIDEMRRQKLWIWSSEPAELRVWEEGGVQVVPLPATEIATSLQTGLIDSVLSSPLLAAASQWFGVAHNMANMEWSPLFGAIIITTRAWERLDRSHHALFLQAAQSAAAGIGTDADAQAIEIMRRHGLVVHPVSPASRLDWIAQIQGTFDTLFDGYLDPAIYALIRGHLRAYR